MCQISIKMGEIPMQNCIFLFYPNCPKIQYLRYATIPKCMLPFKYYIPLLLRARILRVLYT